MAHINTIQESMDLDKMKPKIKKAKKIQDEFEKGKTWKQIDHKTWILQK
jgi:hypothetical protein